MHYNCTEDANVRYNNYDTKALKLKLSVTSNQSLMHFKYTVDASVRYSNCDVKALKLKLLVIWACVS